MSDINIQNVLNQMRTMAAQAKSAPAAPVEQTQGADFSSLLKQSVNTVNQTQKTAGKMSQAFQAGDPNVQLSDVMVAMQKSSVSFEAMKQVRGKLIEAYKEVMRMQV
jgi:flagellar hook-basal body complex protein FliE